MRKSPSKEDLELPKGSRIRTLDVYVKTAFVLNDIHKIDTILKFSLYGNTCRLRRLLSQTDLTTQRKILARHDVIGSARAPWPAGPDMVEVIVSIYEPCEREISIALAWQPLREEHVSDPYAIATKMDTASRLIFARPDFKEWARVSTGYGSTEIDLVRSEHVMMSYRLNSYLLRHHNERHKYRQVAEILGEKNSMACQVVWYALREPRPSNWPHTILNLDFIIAPLRRFLSRIDFSFTWRALPLMKIRFHRSYRVNDAEPIGWRRPLETDMTLYSDVLAAPTSKGLVARWTALDENALKQVVGSEQEREYRIRQARNQLMHRYAECALAYPLTSGLLVKLAWELKWRCNWYRLSAIIEALMETPFNEPYAPRLSGLVNPIKECGKFCQQMKLRPRLPFLISNTEDSADISTGTYHQITANHPQKLPPAPIMSDGGSVRAHLVSPSPAIRSEVELHEEETCAFSHIPVDEHD